MVVILKIIIIFQIKILPKQTVRICFYNKNQNKLCLIICAALNMLEQHQVSIKYSVVRIKYQSNTNHKLLKLSVK